MEHNKVQKIPFGAFSKAKAMVSYLRKQPLQYLRCSNKVSVKTLLQNKKAPINLK